MQSLSPAYRLWPGSKHYILGVEGRVPCVIKSVVYVVRPRVWAYVIWGFILHMCTGKCHSGSLRPGVTTSSSNNLALDHSPRGVLLAVGLEFCLGPLALSASVIDAALRHALLEVIARVDVRVDPPVVAIWKLPPLGRTGAVRQGRDWKGWHAEMGKHVRGEQAMPAERWRL